MGKKVLVVDNNSIILEFMKDLLAEEGHEVLTAGDGLSALDILETCVPDVMFVDLIMPNIDGKKLCKIIRDMPKLKDTYVAILSATAAEDEAELKESGADFYIPKGPLREMAQPILSTIEVSEQKTPACLEQSSQGLKGLFPREITKELLSKKRDLEAILESMSEGILELTPEKRIVYANPAALSVIGIPEDKLLGKNLIALFREDDHQRVEGLLKNSAAGAQMTGEQSLLRLNNKILVFTVIPISGKESKYIIVLNDITERKNLEAQLLQGQKMHAIGSLAGGIAHEFNNLLMGIQGHVSMMKLDASSDKFYPDKLAGIEAMIRRGADLTGELLRFAQEGKYEVKPTDVNFLILRSSQMFSRTKKNITISCHYQKDIWAVEVDQGQLEQALLNLFVNAEQAMPKGGELFLQTQNITLDEDAAASLNLNPWRYVKVTVTDTGVGMDEETQKRIFDPFFTTKGLGKAPGLGLASAYGIIKGHNGYIGVYSEKGKGTTFTIFLPASEKKVEREREVPESIVRGTEVVLLVDDEDMIIEAAERMLSFMGYTVLRAKKGEEAISIYEKNADTVKLVLLDMIMPGMGGGETYDRLKAVNPEVKVLLSSGYGIDGLAKELLDRGCKGFMQKPFDMKRLSQKVREVLDQQ